MVESSFDEQVHSQVPKVREGTHFTNETSCMSRKINTPRRGSSKFSPVSIGLRRFSRNGGNLRDLFNVVTVEDVIDSTLIE